MELDNDVIAVAYKLSDLRMLLLRLQNECDDHAKELATKGLSIVDETCNLLDPINDRLSTVDKS